MALGAGLLAAAMPVCLRAQPAGGRIVASFSILADMARQVMPDGVGVDALVGPDADAHAFDPTPADGRRLARAGLVVVNGLGFEGWIDRLVQASGYQGQLVVASAGIAARRHGLSLDPHAWHDLAHGQQYVRNLSHAVSKRWPMHRARVETKAADYLAAIDRLDAELRRSLQAVPRDRRKVITSHDAFGYLGAAYGIDFMAPQGWTMHSQPSPAAVAMLLRQIKKHKVRAVFVENISDMRLMARIAEESGARIGGTLYSDALSAAGGPADSYLKLVAHNMRTIVDALGATS